MNGLLVGLGTVLGLYALYFYVVFLSNRATRRLAQRKKAAGGTGRRVDSGPTGRALDVRWVIVILLVACGGLAGVLAFITQVSR